MKKTIGGEKSKQELIKDYVEVLPKCLKLNSEGNYEKSDELDDVLISIEEQLEAEYGIEVDAPNNIVYAEKGEDFQGRRGNRSEKTRAEVEP